MAAGDINGPHTGTYRNTDDLDPSLGDPMAGCNKGGMGDITREIHQTILPGDVNAAAQQAQSESDAAFRALQRSVGGGSTLPKK